MKKTATLLLLASILTIAGCSDKKDFTLKGRIDDLLSDTLIAYHLQPTYKIDTIICTKGAFEYSFVPDTLTVFRLILNEKESIPVFAEKSQSVEIKGSTSEFNIKGEGENALMNDIFTLLRNTPEENTMHLIDSLINANAFSYTNLYLIDKYYAHNESVDYKHLENLIAKQGGVIKDTPYIMELQTRINLLRNKEKNQNILALTGKDREGKSIKWPTNRNNYILIDFWASWNPESVAAQDSLANVLKALKKENFLVFSISLDMDKEAWLKASDRDTTQWRQVCDFKGWNNHIIKTQGIHKLPSNILLDKNKHIIARDIRGKELIDKVKNLIQKDKDREKERKARIRKK